MTCRNEQIVQLMNDIDELYKLRSTLSLAIREKEEKLQELRNNEELCNNISKKDVEHFYISKRDVIRYSRQIIIPQVRIIGQLKLQRLSVLIVGVGGLGCPAALYLAGAGVGRLGLVDYDDVEESNLHRQLLHNENELGRPKVSSAASSLRRINSCLKVDEHKIQLNSNNALHIVDQYDIVVDASDNVATRYLVNDACVLAKRPLVSGSALQMEGQLTVYNHGEGPCYRCLYPHPPPPETVSNCSDAGVLGTVPGVIGTLQAMEVLKIALDMKDVLSSRLLLFDGETTTFRTIKLRKKNKDCPVCGTNPSITQLIDYEQFCGAAANDKDLHLSLLDDNERVSAEDLHILMKSGSPCVIIDVRQEIEYEMCSIPGSLNIPLASLTKNIEHIQTITAEKVNSGSSPILVCMVCRRGNDSQLAVRRLQPLLAGSNLPLQLKDLRGGLHSWSALVDPQFPNY